MVDTSDTDGGRASTTFYSQGFVECLGVDENGFYKVVQI
jgi:hypothetical protein